MTKSPRQRLAPRLGNGDGRASSRGTEALSIPIPRDWRTGRAVAAIIVVERQGYLLQLRDERSDIWYPGYWGLFGGTLNPGETPEIALRRELAEELSLEVAAMQSFMSMDIGFSFAEGRIYREFFEVRLPASMLAALRLWEGREMRSWPACRLSVLRLVPADRVALDFHVQQTRTQPMVSAR